MLVVVAIRKVGEAVEKRKPPAEGRLLRIGSGQKQHLDWMRIINTANEREEAVPKESSRPKAGCCALVPN